MGYNSKFDKFGHDKKQSETKVLISIGIAVLTIISFAISGGESGVFFILGIILGIVTIIVLGIGLSEYGKVKKGFKNDVLKDMFKTLIPDISYQIGRAHV